MKSLRMGDSHETIGILGGHDWSKSESGVLHSIVECGVYRGATARAICASFMWAQYYGFDSYAEYATADPYRKSGDGCSKLTAKQQAENMAAARDAIAFAGNRAHIFQATAMEGALAYTAGIATGELKKVSAVLHDSDHTYDAVAKELRAWYPLIEKGGLLMAHDYGHKRNNSGHFGVDRAVNEFADEYELTVNVRGTLAWTVKP